MQRREDIKVKPGFEYDHYFPKAKLITITKKQGAKVEDTLLLIPAVVRETLFHTKRFAKAEIESDTLRKTCQNLWQFVYDHIAYKKDEDGKEQVRSPARTWHDRFNNDGVDCDCYTVFISSVLSNLNIKHKLRITKYTEDHFQHIYPIVPIGNGKYITIDCVVNSFDYEEPFSEKQDTNMDLEYLNGVNDTRNFKGDSQDFMNIMGEQEAVSELGKLFKHKTSHGSGGNHNKHTTHAKKKGRLKNFLKKGLHATNRFNPVTVALRNGVLAGMKLNFLKIASNLRYAYLSEDQAKQKGFILSRYHKLKTIKDKLEKIFYGAGGKPENLKKAILTGHGNKNREVPLNGLGYTNEDVDSLHEDMPLSQLLGSDIYNSENKEDMEGFKGFGALGEPVTAASIAAASTVLTAVAALIKNVGSLKPKPAASSNNNSGGSGGGGGSDDSGGGSSSSDSSDSGDNSSSSDNSGGSTPPDQSSDNSSSDNSSDNSTSTDDTTDNSSSDNSSPDTSSQDDTNDSGDANQTDDNNSSAPENNDNENSNDNSGTDDNASKTDSDEQPVGETPVKPTFWANNKKWIKPVGIGIGSLGLLALIYHLLKPKPKPALNGAKKTKPKKNLLGGIKSKKKKGGHHPAKRQKSIGQKKVITLL